MIPIDLQPEPAGRGSLVGQLLPPNQRTPDQAEAEIGRWQG